MAWISAPSIHGANDMPGTGRPYQARTCPNALDEYNDLRRDFSFGCGIALSEAKRSKLLEDMNARLNELQAEQLSALVAMRELV